MLVKICGLGSAEQVQAAVDAGADAVGFVFAESVRRVTPEQAARYAADVPPGVKRVAVMLHPTNADWQDVLQGLEPDVLQTDAAYREGKDAMVAAETFVYEGAKSGQGETVDWGSAAALARRGNMILAGGLSAQNVAEAVMTVKPYGVDVSSAVESAPGQKDAGLIEQFIKAARAAEQRL
jgi:phosphoribosylanthranilate isomerase